MRPKIVIAHDATREADDGLALAGDLDISAIAVALDALVVRPVLLPAAVQLLGRRSWWPTAPHSIQPSSPGGAS